MYGQHPLDDTVRVLRAWATNQVARFAPRTYLRISRETGRGQHEQETPNSIAEYFYMCFREYFEVLGVETAHIPDFLSGKVLMEYGPGDIPGVALLMLAHGAEKVFCVDRFSLFSLSPDNAAVIEALLGKLPPRMKARAEADFRHPNGELNILDSKRIEYLVQPSGLSGLRCKIDFVFSRAVLEHVNDVPATFVDMEASMRPRGIAIHLIDLKSHGLHRLNPLDFLSWPMWLWQLMYSQKGVPNRWRVNYYRQAIRASGLTVQLLAPTARAAASDVAEIRPHLAAPYRSLPDEDLACLGFWLVCRK